MSLKSSDEHVTGSALEAYNNPILNPQDVDVVDAAATSSAMQDMGDGRMWGGDTEIRPLDKETRAHSAGLDGTAEPAEPSEPSEPSEFSGSSVTRSSSATTARATGSSPAPAEAQPSAATTPRATKAATKAPALSLIHI